MAKAGTKCTRCGATHGITPEIWNKWELVRGKWYCAACKTCPDKPTNEFSAAAAKTKEVANIAGKTILGTAKVTGGIIGAAGRAVSNMVGEACDAIDDSGIGKPAFRIAKPPGGYHGGKHHGH